MLATDLLGVSGSPFAVRNSEVVDSVADLSWELEETSDKVIVHLAVGVELSLVQLLCYFNVVMSAYSGR